LPLRVERREKRLAARGRMVAARAGAAAVSRQGYNRDLSKDYGAAAAVGIVSSDEVGRGASSLGRSSGDGSDRPIAAASRLTPR